MSYIVELNEDSQETIGEKSSLIAALQEFKKSYEEKIKAFDSYGSDNCILQAKINFQQEWINDLTEQNEMLVHTVEELEQEATERVLSLEKKLKQSSQCASEEMDKLQSDVKNLVTLITRIREDPDLNFEDLEFFTISKKELTNGSNKMRKSRITFQDDGFQMEEKEAKIRELESKLENAQSCSIIKDKYNSLKQSMLDMRDALTAEVADKHDTILSLRRDVQILEEQCRKADQQTHFKDDIIKELRKENKQFKQEIKVLKEKCKKCHTPEQKSCKFGYCSKHNPTCPIKSHNTLQKYIDSENKYVIFVCQDMKQKDMRRLLMGNKMEVVYENPKIVHELCTQYLTQFEEPERLVSQKSTNTYTNTSDIFKPTFEIINSHPPCKNIENYHAICEYIHEDPKSVEMGSEYVIKKDPNKPFDLIDQETSVKKSENYSSKIDFPEVDNTKCFLKFKHQDLFKKN